MTTLETVRLEDTAFGTLASQHRLLNAVLKEPLPKAVLAGYLHNFAWLKDVADVLADFLVPEGTYLFFVNNIDFLKQYTVPLPGGIIAKILPLDESTVWKETLELVGIEKNDVKKMSGPEKLEHVLNALADETMSYPELSYEDGVATMEPVRNRNENRPV